jgi:hypothetical protein
MSADTGLKLLARTPATDEVLRRVGRNLINFQLVESALKALVTRARFQAPASQLAERLGKHTSAHDRRTMGALAGKFVDTVLQPPPEEDTPDVVDEIWLRFSFCLETDAQTTAHHEAELKELVARRNELVHHFLPHWQAAVIDGVEPALAWLDAQNEAAMAMLDRLHRLVQTVASALQENTAFLASEEGQRQLDLLLNDPSSGTQADSTP